MAKENPTVYSSEGDKNNPFKSLESLKKPVAEKGGKKEIKKSVGADINKDAGSLKKMEKFDFRQAAFEKRIQEFLPGIFSAEAIEEAINADITSEKKAEKARKIIGRVKDDLSSVAGDPEWYKLKWRDDELKNALKRHFIKKTTHYFNTEKLTGAKKFYNYLEGLCKIEKREQKEQKEQPFSEEKKEFLKNFGKEIEKGVLEKLNENDKEIPGQKPVKEKEFIKLRRITPLAKKAIYEVREAFQKNNNLKEEDIASLLQKGSLKHLSPREKNLVMMDFEQLVRKTDKEQKKEKFLTKQGKTSKQLDADIFETQAKAYGRHIYAKNNISEDAKEFERKERVRTFSIKGEVKKTEKSDREEMRGKILSQIKAAAEVGDEETLKKLQEELKTGEQLFEEAQALEADKKFREENPPLRKMEEIERERTKNAQREINDKFPPKKEVMEQEIKRPIEEIERERAEKAQKEIDKYFPETKENAEEPKTGKTTEKEKDEKIKEFFAGEEIERKGIPLNRQEELEKLKGELETARKEYIEMDYKKRDMWARVRNHFGNILGKSWKERRRDDITTNERGAVKDDDVLYLEAIYKNKLFDYKNALLDEIFAKNLPEEENKKRLAEAVNYFGKEEFIKLSEACNDARAEYMKKEEPTMGERIASGLSRIERSYYKLPKAARYAIGIGTMASGVGFLIGGKRILSGFLLGYSTYRAGAGIDNFMAGRQDKRFQKKTLRDFENRENKYKFINDKLNEKLFNVDERLHGRDWRKLSYAAAGAVLGTLVGTGKAAEFAHWLAQEANIGAIPEKFHSLIKNVREMLGGAPIEDYPVPKVPIAPEAPVASEIPVTPEAPEVSPVNLVVEKGSSLEKTLISYIQNHQSEIYDHHPELKNFDPGQIAHRMYVDYLDENANPLNKSLNLVYPGARLEINPATLEISSFSDTKGAIGRAIEQVAGNHDKWTGMKNLSLKELADAAKNKIAGLSGEYVKFWGPEAEIKSGERLRDWIARVVRLAAEKK